MKKKQIEKLKPVKTRKKGCVLTVQYIDNIIILNVLNDGSFEGRQCIDSNTGEYEQYNAKDKAWSRKKLYNLLGITAYDYYWNTPSHRDGRFASKADEQKVNELLCSLGDFWAKEDTISLIDTVETHWGSLRRQRTEHNRVDRITELMSRIDAVPVNVAAADKWLHNMTGAEDFAFYFKNKKEYSCTACKTYFDESLVVRTDGEKKVRHNDFIICPNCGKHIQVKRRTDNQKRVTSFAILQKVDDEISVYRSFDVFFYWYEKSRHSKLSEAVRIVMYKTGRNAGKNVTYYGGYSFGYVKSEMTDMQKPLIISKQVFDNKHNYGQRWINAQMLYPEGIEEAMQGTCAESISKLIQKMAAEKRLLHYHKIICCKDKPAVTAFEYLYKGRFYRLLMDFIGGISEYSGEYQGTLVIYGSSSINEVLQLNDTQKIHRLRDIDGGMSELLWLRYSDKNNVRISEKALRWLADNNIYPASVETLLKHMTPDKAMNYIIRQQSEGCSGKSIADIVEMYEDYISMCVRLKKDTDDEMVYKPRELKRRHDEAVMAIERERIIEEMNKDVNQRETEAQKMREKFPGCEEILKAIKHKYEYANDEYMMKVPQNLIEIIQEGAALHHCVGSADRYFDRIRNNETYICFLRKITDPDVPFYTIEFEPTGTIRQHRSYLDEEPGIEYIRDFLKEWQREIKKRLKKKDYELGQISADKRVENIRELERNRNTRVLAALAEDFMEAM